MAVDPALNRGLEGAFTAPSRSPPAPRSGCLVRRHKGSTAAVAQLLGVSQRTVERLRQRPDVGRCPAGPSWFSCSRSIRRALRPPAPPRRRRSPRRGRAVRAGPCLHARPIASGLPGPTGTPPVLCSGPSSRVAAADGGRGLSGLYAQFRQPLLLLGEKLCPGARLALLLEPPSGSVRENGSRLSMSSEGARLTARPMFTSSGGTRRE